ncbi:MAG: type IV toxin-antitoxin system AbiEi family antitoxin domain-containing protein [Kiritimatiellae bacterium]|nr:type IV toxin-antitoxin system AbiEi family antitoxin domain-containing protein [Kiritimatiellia bacterium]
MRRSVRNGLTDAGRDYGTFTPSEAQRHGISTRTLYRMLQSGKVTRLSRGVYQMTDAPDAGSTDYAVIAKRVPNGVVCLLSALYHHDLTTEIPHTIYLAVTRDARVPRLDYPRVRVFRMSSASFTPGIENKVIGGIETRIYSQEKTIADCFKFRNSIGLDVAVEALKNYMARRGRNPDRVLEMAKVCRVEKVMRPYLETLV